MTHISREIAPFKCVLGKRRDDHPTLSLIAAYVGVTSCTCMGLYNRLMFVTVAKFF